MASIEIGSCWKPGSGAKGHVTWCIVGRDASGRLTARSIREDGSLTKSRTRFAPEFLRQNYRRVPNPAKPDATSPSGEAVSAGNRATDEHQ